MDKEVSGFIGL